MSFPSEQPLPFASGLRWLIWALYVIAWSTALLTPQPVHFAEAVLPATMEFFSAKLLHISAYAVFILLSAWLQAPQRYRFLLLLFVSAHAFATEFLQGFVPERYPSLRDVGLDHVGLLLGVALTWRWWR